MLQGRLACDSECKCEHLLHRYIQQLGQKWIKTLFNLIQVGPQDWSDLVRPEQRPECDAKLSDLKFPSTRDPSGRNVGVMLQDTDEAAPFPCDVKNSARLR